MKPLPKLVSKSKLMRGYRCHKSLYLTIQHPELEAPITPELQAKFDFGNYVGELAREKHTNGVLVDNKPWDFVGSLNRTKELIQNGAEVIFEAAFAFKGCYARVDLLQFSKTTQRWSMTEVKSSTKVKPEHFEDVALQAWIVAKTGLPLEKISLMHLNKECVYPNLSNLFVEVDVTEQVREQYPKVAERLNGIMASLKTEKTMQIDIGPHCMQKPNVCQFKEACWKEKEIPETSIFNIYLIKDKAWDFYRQGILSIDDPRIDGLDELQTRIVQAHRSQKPFIDGASIKQELETWKFPLVFLDFETIGPGIPRFPGTTPYMQVPFQFSVHIWRDPKSDQLEHFEYLHEDQTDPRPQLIEALLRACGTKGSIVAYYQKFEKSRINELAEFSPTHKEALLALEERVVDPLPVFQKHVYFPEFAGSFSLKAVAPAVLGQEFSYEGLEVADGTAAQRAFEELIDPHINPERKASLRAAMLEYCQRDTLATVGVSRWLMRQV